MKVEIAVFLCIVGLSLAWPAAQPQPEAEPPSIPVVCKLGTTPTDQSRSDAIHDIEDRIKRVKENVEKMRVIGIKQITSLAKLISSNPCLNVEPPQVPTPNEAPDAPAAEEGTFPPAVIDASIRELCKSVTLMEAGIQRMKHIGLTNIDKMARFTALAGPNLCPAVAVPAETDASK